VPKIFQSRFLNISSPFLDRVKIRATFPRLLAIHKISYYLPVSDANVSLDFVFYMPVEEANCNPRDQKISFKFGGGRYAFNTNYDMFNIRPLSNMDLLIYVTLFKSKCT